MSSTLRKIVLVKDTEQREKRRTTAWAQLLPGYEQWYKANYDEAGAYIGPCLLVPKSPKDQTQEEQS